MDRPTIMGATPTPTIPIAIRRPAGAIRVKGPAPTEAQRNVAGGRINRVTRVSIHVRIGRIDRLGGIHVIHCRSGGIGCRRGCDWGWSNGLNRRCLRPNLSASTNHGCHDLRGNSSLLESDDFCSAGLVGDGRVLDVGFDDAAVHLRVQHLHDFIRASGELNGLSGCAGSGGRLRRQHGDASPEGRRREGQSHGAEPLCQADFVLAIAPDHLRHSCFHNNNLV